MKKNHDLIDGLLRNWPVLLLLLAIVEQIILIGLA